MKTTLLWLLMLCCFPLFGSENYEHFLWNRGEITLTDKSVVKGLVGYDHTQGVVMVTSKNGVTKAFSPHKVQHFTFFDDILSIERLYVSLSVPQKRKAPQLYFFEVVMDGTFAILRREKKYANIKMTLTVGNNGGDFARHAACFDYYAFSDGEFYSMMDFEEKLYPKLLEYNETAIENLVTEKELDIRYLNHQILVLDFYNSLREENYKRLQLAQAVQG